MSKVLTKVEEEVVSVASAGTHDDEHSAEYRKLAKRVIWKFDLHILPPLALVSDLLESLRN